MINTIKTAFPMVLRSWQSNDLPKIHKLVTTPAKVMPVNACVGSGKTFIAAEAMGQYISTHKHKKTVQAFVAPTIALCNQQAAVIKYVLKARYNLTDELDYTLIPIDCTKCKFNYDNFGKHIIFVICAESLWGTEIINKRKINRFNNWLAKFKYFKNEGYNFGVVALDEAHNYEEKRDYIINEKNSLYEFFKLVPLSGTPSAFQKELSELYPDMVCECPPKLAVDNGWIAKAVLNLIVCEHNLDWLRAIAAVIARETEICKLEKLPSRIIINCAGRDEIKALIESDYIRNNTGKRFNVIATISAKVYKNEDSSIIEVFKPTINGTVVSDTEINQIINNFDENTYLNNDLPTIIFQVKKLSEGININSCNACITVTNSDRTAMQQIGRIIRDYKYNNNKTKVKHGHANVYVLLNNVKNISILLKNLEEECSLTADCFDWGKCIDIPTSSGINDDPDAIATMNTFNWHDIDTSNHVKIIDDILKKYGTSLKRKYLHKVCTNKIINADNNSFEQLLESLAKDGILTLWSRQKTFSAKTEQTKRKKIQKSIDKTSHSTNKKTNKKPKEKSIDELESFMILNNWLNTLHNTITNSDSHRAIWSINPKLFITYALCNDKIAEWLTTHLTNEELEALSN